MMNYVGSISILDRGDAPAQAIIDKNARSLAQRVADETRDELEKVMTRVDNIYESYEASTQALMETQSTLEYVEDIAELEALIKDQIKKKKYQQQVTIFIVGYENVCGQKLRLLQQVNEFFMDNSKSYEEEDWYPKTPDIDLDDCSNKIEESLSTAKELTEKISTINADMVEWLTTYAINKASTKSKKKLESALTKAKDDVKAITEQLKSALLANDEKDELIQTYLKQLEGKTLEAQKFKAAAEVAKKNVQGLEAKELVYQDEIEKRTSAMKRLQEDLRKLEMDASQSKFLSELNSNRLKNKDSETSVKIDELQTVIERHKLELQESKRELQALHQDQIKALHDTHAADIETVRLEYADMIKKLQDDLQEAQMKVDDTEKLVADATDAADQARQELLALQLEGSTGDSRPQTEVESQLPETEDDGISRDSSRQESRPSTKDTRSSKGAPAKVTVTRTTPAVKVVTKPTKPEAKSPVKPVKETADASIQDEGGDPTSAHVETRQSKRARSTLETVKESDLSAEFDDAFDLGDENSWALVPVENVPGRFAQYRKMTVRKLSELEEQLSLTVAKTQRKVTTLKSQFQEHKSKWETERKVLIEQVEQAQKLQTEAEKEADVAMTQLEEFINEQERLEEEEEVKRQEVVKGVSKPVMVSIPTQHDDEESEVVTSSSPKTLTPVQPGGETGAPPPTFVQSEESEHELTNLMQQTDDAKYERQRSDSKAISRRSSSINSDVAPWLLGGEKKPRPASDNDENEEEEEEGEETVFRSSASKASFRAKSEQIASEMSKLEEPDEAEEDERDEGKEVEDVMDEDLEGTIVSKKSQSSQGRRSVASKLSKKSLSRTTTKEDTQEVVKSRETTPEREEVSTESDQESKASRSSKIPSQVESERSKVNSQRSKSKVSVSQDEGQRSPSHAEEEVEEESGSHHRSRRGSHQSRSQTRSTLRRRSSVKSIERDESQKSLERVESQKSKVFESGATSRKSMQSRITSRKSEPTIVSPRKSEQEGSRISRKRSDLELEDVESLPDDSGNLESRKSISDDLSRRSTKLSKHLTVEDIGNVAEDTVLTERSQGERSHGNRSQGDIEFYSEETEDEPVFDVRVVTQESRKTASQQQALDPTSGSGTAQESTASPRSLRSVSQAQEINSRKSMGALSAPPAVEPESEPTDKTRSVSAPRSPPLSRSRGSVVSQYVTRGMTGTTPIEELSEIGSGKSGKSRSRSAGSYKEWILRVTPQYGSRQGSSVTGQDIIDALIVDDNLPKCQSSALNNMKTMMEEDNMSSMQHRTLESVRSALKTLNEKEQELSDLQLERTITLISLASQLTEESIQLGVLPESMFDAFAEINSRAMSNMSPGEDPEILIDDTQGAELLRPMTQGSVLTETQTQMVPKTEEEIRASSALSRASLRKEYRNKLGEVRAAVEDRRTKSPAISIPSQRSLEDDQLIDEDDDDDIPYNEVEDMKREQTMEIGTSPPPGQKGPSSSKLSNVSADHPIVSEYLRLYEGVVQFRNALSKLMVDRDMLQPSEILEDIDTKKFNSTGKVEPQIEGMTHNVYHVFEEILSVLSSIIQTDREPMVSSLTGGGMVISRDTTQAAVGPKSAESGRGPTVTRASHHSQFSAKSDVSERIALRELQDQYDRLQLQLTTDTRKHEEQLRHNTVVMMEMQDTINDLQRELSNLGRSSSRLRPQSDTTSPHGTNDSAIMFTRLDSERNAKIMKRAVNDQKMNPDQYKDALDKMEDYVGLPAQRLAHLVRKYVHHSRMKEIEENVKKSKSLNENVFEILDKMEALQNERAKTWADKMDQMGSERIRLANLLMETLDSIEQESGIFLIKPMYSYRGRDIKDARYGGKLTRPSRPHRNLSPHRDQKSSFAPAPTPASNMRLIRGQPVPTTQSMTHETTVPKQEVQRPLEGDEGGISGASLNWVGTSQKQTWSMNSSLVRGDPENFLSSQNPNAMNTPRILELDINRMLIGQNTISSKITQPGMTEDRLVNASQNNLRSYVTVNRPTAQPVNARPRSFASSATKEYVPPSSPVSQNTKRVRMSDGDMSRMDMSRNMTNTPPLPPIGSATSRDIPGEPPRSPPGSSMRLSPPHVQEVISPLK